MRCKVQSGDFEKFIDAESLIEAAKKAIIFHRDNCTEKLSEITLVQEIKQNLFTGNHIFVSTATLIEG
jgi:hypothetical protein